MSDRGLDSEYRRDRRRRYSSESEDDRKRKDRAVRRRSFDRPRSRDQNGGRARDDSRSDHRRRRHRSRSPRPDRARVKREPSSRSRSPPHRPRDDRKHSRRDYSASRSPPPPPKRRRHDSRDYARRNSTHRHTQRRSRSPSPPPHPKRSTAPLPSQQAAFKNETTTSSSSTTTALAHHPPTPDPSKQKPNYAPTGKLAAETNTVANTSIVLKYNEPPEARLPPSSSPSSAWRLYVFKGENLLETLPLFERSCWLFGRERAVVDFVTEHPSCSKQHAVLQFRYVEEKRGRRDRDDGGDGDGEEWGAGMMMKKGVVRPYVIDLESANGTRVNGVGIPGRRYVEVRSGDVVTFGESTREYVLMLPPKDTPKG